MASRASDIDQSAHPYSIYNALAAGTVLCLTLATLTTAIRLYTKFFIIKSHGWEDCKWRSFPVCAGCWLIRLQILCLQHGYLANLFTFRTDHSTTNLYFDREDL